MGELEEVVCLLAFAYASAVLGLTAALAGRAWFHRRGRVPGHVETTVCVVLPPLAVLLLPILSSLQPHATSYLASIHTAWHHWERVAHATPAVHRILHVANLGLLVVAAYGVVRAVHGLARRHAFAKAVRAVARPRPSSGPDVPVCVIPGERVLCFTLGAWRAKVFVTSRLLETLQRREFDAVLAHEAAHARRRDGLSAALLATIYELLPLPSSALLQRDWSSAVERACDAEAARALGTPLDVAAALVRVAGLVQGEPISHSIARPFADRADDVPARVQALLTLAGGGQASRPGGWTASGILAAASLVFIAVAGFWVSHAVELFARH